VADFIGIRSLAGAEALPDRVRPKLMIANSKAVAAEEVRDAAAYFSSLPAKRWVRVVEADEAPKVAVSLWALVPTGTGAGSADRGVAGGSGLI
jgi:hypothetical protein